MPSEELKAYSRWKAAQETLRRVKAATPPEMLDKWMAEENARTPEQKERDDRNYRMESIIYIEELKDELIENCSAELFEHVDNGVIDQHKQAIEKHVEAICQIIISEKEQAPALAEHQEDDYDDEGLLG